MLIGLMIKINVVHSEQLGLLKHWLETCPVTFTVLISTMYVCMYDTFNGHSITFTVFVFVSFFIYIHCSCYIIKFKHALLPTMNRICHSSILVSLIVSGYATHQS